MFWHGFGRGGGGAPLSLLSLARGGMVRVSIVSRVSRDKKILREKNIILCSVVASHIEMVPEGTKCLFSQCEKRHFVPSGTYKFEFLLT